MRRRVTGLLLAVVLLTTPAFADDDHDRCSDPLFADRYACREVIVHYEPSFDVVDVSSRYGLRLIGTLPQISQAWFEAPVGTDMVNLLGLLETEPGIVAGGVDRNGEFVSPECRQINLAILELGQGWGSEVLRQPALQAMNAPLTDPAAGDDIIIAILDTGISRSHADLADSLITPGIDPLDGTLLADDTANGLDDNGSGVADEGWGHGTSVAGLIHAIAPGAQLLPVKVLNDECEGTAFALAAGIVEAVDAGARIINASLGSSEELDVIEVALAYASEHGVIVVASAGHHLPANTEDAEVAFPAEDDESIAVGAVDDLLVAPAWSVTDEDVGLSAPGVDLIAPYRDGYARVSGTSFSTALVSGAAAIAWWAHPTLDRDDILRHISMTAISVDRFNAPELEGDLGAGIPDLQAIVGVTPLTNQRRSDGDSKVNEKRKRHRLEKEHESQEHSSDW